MEAREAGDLVLRFVRSIGRPKEADFYLSLFRAERPESFAVIAVADAVMAEAQDALLTDLRFLARLGLTPVILFGVLEPGDDLDDGPGNAQAHAEWVARRLAPDVRARVTTADQATGVAQSGAIPLIALSAPRAGREAPAAMDRRFDQLAGLATSLATRKIIFLGRNSGLQPQDGPVPSLVDLTSEYDLLCSRLDDDEAALLRQARRLIDAVPHPMTLAVTSPLDLLRELFTVRGAGTLMRRGSEITRYGRYQDADPGRVRQVIESAFGRKLAPGFLDRPITALYVADDYRGLAIVQATAHGPYLSKFAVEQSAQGEGVGRDLWRALVRDHATLLWRGRADNPITQWYQQRCDGMLRTPTWHVFWRGLTIERLPAAIELALSAPADLLTTPAA